jgi:hypothetical protein
MILLNEKEFPTMSDGKPMIPLNKGDAFWAEISEDPKQTVAKLWQLQCAFCALCEHKDEAHEHPKAAIVCLNGDKGTFNAAVEHIKGILSAEVEEGAKGILSDEVEEGDEDALEEQVAMKEAWTIFGLVSVFAVYTPYRNVYSSLRDVNRRLDSMDDKLEKILAMVAAMASASG